MSTKEILFSLNGRINRAKYWLYCLLLGLAHFIWAVITLIIFGEDGFFVPYFLGSLFLIYPGLAMNVKRCHDRGRSGWFVLVSFIPIVSIWYLIEVGFLKGDIGDNGYGPDPLVVPEFSPATP